MSEIKVNKISPKQTCTQLTLGDPLDTIIIPANTTTSVAGTLSVTGNLLSDTLKNANSSTLITQTNSTTITLGFSGATIAVATGVSQSGIGRQGAVTWSSTIQTTGFTAVSGNGYFCNTTAGAFTVTLPASAVAGDILAFKDYAGTWGTNNLTLATNGLKIEGSTSNGLLSTSGQSITLVYVDSTRGWSVVDDGLASSVPQPKFVTATGGTVTTDGNFKVHTFTGSSSFVVSCAGNPLGSTSIDYLVVGGGGSGGPCRGGGGGAGGFRTLTSQPVTATTYPVTVGGGGNGSTCGSPSIFISLTSAGGGKGGNWQNSGTAGGSGGGGSGNDGPPAFSGGSGNSPAVSPSQGNSGGSGTAGPFGNSGAGAGGGASASGGNGATQTGGNGGAGTASSITGSPVFYAGGGAGGADNRNAGTAGTGGVGGGANGGNVGPVPSRTGQANTGGGGSGPSWPNFGTPGQGGSGVVIVRYRYQ